MNLISKKIMLSLGVCTALLTASATTHVYAQTTTTPQTATVGNHNMANAMEAFDKLSPEQQKAQIDQSKKMVAAQMDQMIQKASTPEQKKQLEAAKTKALKQIDAMSKMTPEERKALVAKAQQNVQQQLKNVTPEQLKQLTPEQRAAFEKFKASQDMK